jgi:hypothetical protein
MRDGLLQPAEVGVNHIQLQVDLQVGHQVAHVLTQLQQRRHARGSVTTHLTTPAQPAMPETMSGSSKGAPFGAIMLRASMRRWQGIA